MGTKIEKEPTALRVLLDMLEMHQKNHVHYTGKVDIGILVAKNFASTLLEKEHSDLSRMYDYGVYDTIADQEMQGESKFERVFLTN